MKRFIWLTVLLMAGTMTWSQNRSLTGWCYMGATKASTSGISSTNLLQGVIPSCEVTVFLTGTTTLATLSTDAGGLAPLGNPFTATTAGFWIFFAVGNTAYDVVLSGGNPPNVYPQPVTLTAVQVGGPGGGGATNPGGNPQELQFNGNGFFQGTTGMTWNGNILNNAGGVISAAQIQAAQLISSAMGKSTAPACPNGPNNALTTAGCIISAGAIPGLGSDGNNGITVQGSVIPGNVPTLDIRNPAFAGGAVCDGVTDIGPAVQAAVNALPQYGAEILIVSPNRTTPCYWANPSAITYPSGNNYSQNLVFTLQGYMNIGTTWQLPWGSTFRCNGGSGQVQFQVGPSCTINGPVTSGTLNTAITTSMVAPYSGVTSVATSSGGQATYSGSGFTAGLCPMPAGGSIMMTGFTNAANNGTFSCVSNTTTTLVLANPNAVAESHAGKAFRVYTVTPSSMANIYTGTWLSIADTTSCPVVSMTRTSNVVTAVLNGACHIPAGSMLTVSGMTTTAFNGTFLIINSDYGGSVSANVTLQFAQSGTNTSDTTTGTASGFNEDTKEDVQVVSTTTTTFNAPFYRNHLATAVFGIDTISIGLASKISDLSVTSTGNSFIAGVDTLNNHGGGGSTTLEHVSASVTCGQPLSAFPITFNKSFWFYFYNASFTVCQRPWSVHMMNSYGDVSNLVGWVWFNDSIFMSGMKMEDGASQVELNRTTIEQAARGSVQIDPTFNNMSASLPAVYFNNSGMQDNFAGYKNCLVHQLYPGGGATIEINKASNQCLVNDYFDGSLRVTAQQAAGHYQWSQNKLQGIIGSYNNGQYVDEELRGSEAGMSPVAIPYASSNVNTNPATWSGANCTVAAGALDPMGTFTAGMISATGSCGINILTQSISPLIGDSILYGGWTYSPTAGTTSQNSAWAASYLLSNSSNANWTFAGSIPTQGRSTNFDSALYGDWMHPLVAIATFATANGGAGNLTLSIGTDTTHPTIYWQPFVIYIGHTGFTGTTDGTTGTITGIASTAGLYPGQLLSGTGIQANTAITSVSANSITVFPITNAAGTNALVAQVPLAEVKRWRQQLLHGYVPSSAKTGIAYSVNPINTPGLYGPAVAPTGACTTNGQWVFSQDGHATYCNAGTWATKI